ncbi:hypothetical protein [Caldithrix abyssi]
MENKLKSGNVSMLLLVSGMTERSLKAIKLVRQVCDQFLAHYKLTVLDVYRDASPESQRVLPVAPLLIGNLTAELVAKIKQQAKEHNFFLPVIRAQFISVDEWRGKRDESGTDTKDKNS